MNEKECSISEKCGGCNIKDANYKKQLQGKKNKIEELVKERLGENIQVQDIIGMENPYHYRNKAKFVFGRDKEEAPVMGFFKQATHQIVEGNQCIIQDETANEIAKLAFHLFMKHHVKVYDEDKSKGFLRHLIIRNAISTNEYMIIIVTTAGKLNRRETIIKEMIAKFPMIKTIVQNINEQETNAILGSTSINLYGKGFIVDHIKEYKFKISPLSFYQINSIQTEKLYQKAVEFAEISKNDIVYDLYSGIGTISIFASKYAKKVYGIEVIKEAVKDAVENVKMNRINNVSFLAGRVEVLLPKLCSKENKADVVFVDPPRNGLDKGTIKMLLELEPKKIIYISCNPDTLMDNLTEFRKVYHIKKIQPVDMFPFTSHVECVCVLNRR